MRSMPAALLGLAFVMSAAALLPATQARAQLASGPSGAPPPSAAPPQTMASMEPQGARPPTAASLPIVLHDDGVAATVNDEPITDYELRQRMALFLATSGIQQPTPDILKKVRAQILEQLETEKMQLQEALKKHITVSPTDVDKQMDKISADNHITREQLRNVLAEAGVNESAMRAQIAAQIAWQKAVQDEYEDRINITPQNVDAEIARIAQGANKPHYLVAEIFLSVDGPEVEDKVMRDAQNLESQIQLGAPFQNVARQFSQSPTAATGGDIGWIAEGQLGPELNDKLKTMAVGSISEPIRATGGFYILALRDRQEPVGTKIAAPVAQVTGPAGTLSLARLLFPLGPKPTQQLAENAAKMAMQMRAHITSCDQIPKVAAQVKGVVYQNLGQMKLSDLSSEIQAALGKTGPGDATVPFMDAAGVEMIMRCDKRPPPVTQAFQMPSRQEVEEELFDQQITALARRYMRDLKRGADVEVR